jgi:MEDS: MEthanogen/methylotroph, DcmR Sensory domain
MTWSGFIAAPSASEHAVQLYSELDELTDSVVRFLDAGWRADEPAVVIATSAHWTAFREALEQQGWDTDALGAEHLLTLLDADEAAAALLDGELPSPSRFERLIAATIDGVAARFPDRTLRAFGEIVDVLQRDGRPEAAIALEELWNELAETRKFALLCGYEIDIFDAKLQAGLVREVICRHTHARPAADNARLAAAVDAALADVVGAERAGRIYLEVADAVPHGAVPRAQSVLNWVTTHETRFAEKILARARAHYAAG